MAWERNLNFGELVFLDFVGKFEFLINLFHFSILLFGKVLVSVCVQCKGFMIVCMRL